MICTATIILDINKTIAISCESALCEVVVNNIIRKTHSNVRIISTPYLLMTLPGKTVSPKTFEHSDSTTFFLKVIYK